MRRKYLDRVEVWRSTETYDGYSGHTNVDAQIGTSWARVRTVALDKQREMGLDVSKTQIVVRLRHRADIDYEVPGTFLRFKSKDYTIVSIHHFNLDEKEIEIIAET